MGWICLPQPKKGCFWRRRITSSMWYPSHVSITICSPHWRTEKDPGTCRHRYFKWLLVSWEGNIILFRIFFAVRILWKDLEIPVQQKLLWLKDSFPTCHAFQWLSCRIGFVQMFSLMACIFSIAWTLKNVRSVFHVCDSEIKFPSFIHPFYCVQAKLLLSSLDNKLILVLCIQRSILHRPLFFRIHLQPFHCTKSWCTSVALNCSKLDSRRLLYPVSCTAVCIAYTAWVEGVLFHLSDFRIFNKSRNKLPGRVNGARKLGAFPLKVLESHCRMQC